MPTILSPRFVQFIDRFEQLAGNRALYLSQEGESFSLIAEKKEKTLNAEKILNLAQKTFENLKDFYWLEEDEKTAIQQPMQKLSRALQAFQNRLYQTAPWYWKILHFFGFKRAIERDIHQIGVNILQALAKVEVITPAVVKKSIKEVSQKPKSFLNNFYHFVLGSNPTKVTQLEGNKNFQTLYQMSRLLKAYKKTFPVNSPEILLYEQLINRFDFAYQFSLARSLKLKTDLLVKRLQQFLSDPSQGNVFILPGGSKDHFVLYEIEREAGQPTFSLRVINSNTSTQSWNVKRVIDNKQKDNRAKDFTEQILHVLNMLNKGVLSSEKIQSLTYTGLTSDQFSLDSLTQICSDEEDDMDSVLQNLESCLCRSDGSNRCFSGRPYKKQIKGVCTQKPLSVWLHNQLGDLSYQKFKVFATERLISDLKDRFNQLETMDLKDIGDLTFLTLSPLGLELESEAEEEAIKKEAESLEQRAQGLERESADQMNQEAKVLFNEIKSLAERLRREGRTLSAQEAIAILQTQAQPVLDKRRRKLQALEGRQQA